MFTESPINTTFMTFLSSVKSIMSTLQYHDWNSPYSEHAEMAIFKLRHIYNRKKYNITGLLSAKITVSTSNDMHFQIRYTNMKKQARQLLDL